MQERTRIQQQVAVQNEQQAVAEVNPEFLAALPPNIQEEVLAQQRIEQQRLAAAAANPNDPVDAAAFFQNLQPSLRQAILTDMEDSQISVLPPDLAAEAQNLRRDWENRNRQIMQEQINQIGASGNSGNVGTSPSFSSVLRYRSRLPEPIFSAQNLQRMRWSNWGISTGSTGISGEGSSGGIGSSGRDLISSGSNILADLRMEQQGRPLLDHESLASLLILLFVEANKICTLRFHRVIRNLCYHVPTRDWIIRTILSIIARSNIQPNQNDPQQTISNRPHWLNIRLDAALGNRNNIFIIKKKRNLNATEQTKMRLDESDVDDIANAVITEYSITIHPQAAQVVCRHALDLLISLAKNFPANFLPIKKKASNQKEAQVDSSEPSTSSSKTEQEKLDKSTDFWDILLSLELKAQKRKSTNKTGFIRDMSSSAINVRPQDFAEIEISSFSESPFGQLISMLSFDIILKSSLLTDKLLRLLSFISIGLPDAVQQSRIASETATATDDENTANAAIDPTAANIDRVPIVNATESNTNATNNINRLKPVPVQLDEKCLPESQDNLRLAIEVLTSKSCSEEGLEDATSLLLNLSQCSNVTRTFILNLLIDGAKYLAGVVQAQINELIIDLRLLNQRNRTESGSATSQSNQSVIYEHTNENFAPQPSSSSSFTSKTGASSSKGILQDRFTKETVVITSTSKQKTRCELQLPSMVPLISKTASQSFFLRILKVVIQIRESAKDAMSKESNNSQTNNTTATTSAALSSTSNSATTQTANSAFYNVAASTSGNLNSSSLGNAGGSINNSNNLAKPSTSAAGTKKIILNSIELQPLSETLQLDHLWNTLSDCLVELEENADHHAVLVLQPAVEAFFLVHASSTTTSPPTTAPAKTPNNQPSSVDQAIVEQATVDRDAEVNVANVANADGVTVDNNSEMQVVDETSGSNVAGGSNELSQNSSTAEGTAPVSPISLIDIPNNAIYLETDDSESQQEQPSHTTETTETTSVGDNMVDRMPNQAQQQTPKITQLTSDQKKFLQFAEKHRTVLNQILRQSTVHLSDGPFAVLVDHTRILDFDVKRRYFRTELERMDEGIRREELAVHVHRVTVFEDSFRELYRRNPEEWKNRFYIVFEG